MGLYESTYVRIEHDQYETPAWVTEALLPYLGRGCLRIWEPCSGTGRMVRVLAAGHDVYASDLFVPSEHPEIHRVDFLHAESDISFYPYDGIVTNPPFGREAPKFVRRALELTRKRRGFVAMLLPMNWDTAATRRDLFDECPAFCRKIVLTRRIVWFEQTEKRKSPKENHAWFYRCHRYRGAPTIAYAP